jgi:hypothetical protein
MTQCFIGTCRCLINWLKVLGLWCVENDGRCTNSKDDSRDGGMEVSSLLSTFKQLLTIEFLTLIQ